MQTRAHKHTLPHAATDSWRDSDTLGRISLLFALNQPSILSIKDGCPSAYPARSPASPAHLEKVRHTIKFGNWLKSTSAEQPAKSAYASSMHTKQSSAHRICIFETTGWEMTGRKGGEARLGDVSWHLWLWRCMHWDKGNSVVTLMSSLWSRVPVGLFGLGSMTSLHLLSLTALTMPCISTSNPSLRGTSMMSIFVMAPRNLYIPKVGVEIMQFGVSTRRMIMSRMSSLPLPATTISGEMPCSFAMSARKCVWVGSGYICALHPLEKDWSASVTAAMSSSGTGCKFSFASSLAIWGNVV